MAKHPAPPVKDKPRKIDVKGASTNIVKAFQLVWQAHPNAALGMAGLTLVDAILPAAQAWVAKLIVDSVVGSISAVRGPEGIAALQGVVPFLALEFVLITLATLLNQARTLLEHVLNARLSFTINSMIIRKALSLDLQFFEDSKFYDQLQNARREADWRALTIANTSFMVVQNVITLVSFAVLLFAFSPWVAVILFGASLPAFIAQNKFSELNFPPAHLARAGIAPDELF